MLGKNAEEIFHEIYRAYRTDWSDKHSTVLPKDMVKLVKTVKALYPEKRLLIHFMQPHFPFINSDIGGGALFDGEYASPDDNIWSEARKGKYTKKEIWEAYRQNLKLAMEEVEGLVEVLNGKTVITADHGNLVGKYGLFGHPTGSNLRPLRKVPFDERD